MPAKAKDGPKAASKGSKSSPSRKGSALTSTTNGTQGKKLSSLSSLQPMLSFITSKPGASASVPAHRTNGSSAPAAMSRAEEDRLKMPPPPGGAAGRWKSSPATSSSSVKGKGKAVNGHDIIDFTDEDDDRALHGSTSDWSDNIGVTKPMKGSEHDLWADRFAPHAETELAPGKARIAKVKNWLHESLYGFPADSTPQNGLGDAARNRVRKYKRILLLTGPAGTGKTTTVRVLARQMGVDLVEWGEGVDESALGGGFDRESATTKLVAFLSRHTYAPLDLSSAPAKQKRPRLLLLTGLPNLSHLPTRQAFHAALLDFTRTYSPSGSPLVIIHSYSGSGGRAEESWMDRERGGREGAVEVVGKEVLNSPYCLQVDFIPLAPTFITKALKRVLEQAVPEPKSRPPQSALQLIALTSNGDLRSAINSLQMLCSQPAHATGKKRKKRDDETSSSSKKSGQGSRGGKGAKVDVPQDLRAVLDAVTRREQSLNLFHALGKVLYNKRLGDPRIDDEDQELLDAVKALPNSDPLPSHLKHFDRDKSLVQMESFLPTIPIDASSFALWLHESLPSFCSSIEQVGDAYDHLGWADVMRTDDDIWQSSQQAIAYALHISIRGCLLALPSPVSRRQQKIIKPQFFESYRTERDNVGKLDLALGYIVSKAVKSANIASEIALDSELPEGISAWGGLPGRTSLTTELIPTMIKIQHLRRQPLLPASTQSLAMRSWASGVSRTEELSEKDIPDENDTDGLAAGEDGLGEVGPMLGWDEELPEEEEDAEADEDAIEDFD